MRKEFYILTAAILVIASVISAVSAMGVGTLYAPNEPLIMQPGEVQEVLFNLQNLGAGAVDVVLKAELMQGSEIAAISDARSEYFVKAGTSDTNARLTISIPSDEAIGTKHTVIVSFSTVTSGVSNVGARMGMAIEKSFDVYTGQIKKTQGVETWMLVVGVIALLIILILLFKPKKAARKRR